MTVKASPIITRYETDDPKKKASDDQSMSEAVKRDTCVHSPMYECSLVARHARRSSPRLAWLRAKTSSKRIVPRPHPQREKARGRARRPGPVVALSRLREVPTRARKVVSGTS
eukprot:scaffold260951_cov23-Tisochrysis_lutea.AAC.4